MKGDVKITPKDVKQSIEENYLNNKYEFGNEPEFKGVKEEHIKFMKVLNQPPSDYSRPKNKDIWRKITERLRFNSIDDTLNEEEDYYNSRINHQRVINYIIDNYINPKKTPVKEKKIKKKFIIEGIKVLTTSIEYNYYDFIYEGKKDYNIKGKIQGDTLYLDQIYRDKKTTKGGEIMTLFCKFITELKELDILKDGTTLFVRAEADFMNAKATKKDQEKLVEYYKKSIWKFKNRFRNNNKRFFKLV